MVRSTALMQHDRSGPDPVRITALSVAILANLTIFAFLMQPMNYTVPSDTRSDPPAQIIRREKIKPLPVPVDDQQKKPPQVVTHRPLPPLPKPPPVVTRDSGPMSTVAPQQQQPPPLVTGEGDGHIGLGSTSPLETALTPILSPAPVYPRDAVRDGITGTVLLQLLVGVDGRVLDVQILHGSGNRHLDDAAREQVLRSWRFAPAIRNGVPVEALGRVPIVFTLDGQQ